MNGGHVRGQAGQSVRTGADMRTVGGGHTPYKGVSPCPPPPTAGLSADPGAPLYLRPEEVAKLLRLSVKSVYRLAAEDPTLPVLRLGRTVRFPRERLLKWLRDREQGPGRRSRRQMPPVSEVHTGQENDNGTGGPCAQVCAHKPGEKPS